MQIYHLNTMDDAQYKKLLQRPKIDMKEIMDPVQEILNQVEKRGDEALLEYTKEWDHASLTCLKVTEEEMAAAEEKVSYKNKQSLTIAKSNIERFHKLQNPQGIETTKNGIICWLDWKPIQTVGLYIPGGTAPLVSTILMLGVPATIAGCENIVLCTPPQKDGGVLPEIIVAAQLCGIKHIYKVGGAQAIAAMSIGTETIPKVDKIFGPGNRYVLAAKALVSLPPYFTSIDMLAGPSELMVIADETSNPSWVAADLLSQTEHGQDSQVILITFTEEFAQEVNKEITRQTMNLVREGLIQSSLNYSSILIASDTKQAIDFANQYAPEHLNLCGKKSESLVPKVHHAGSVFIGPLSSVVFGDYASGTNHTLPTHGTARAVGCLSVFNYMKTVAFQTVTKEGLDTIGDTIIDLANIEGLEAHAKAIELRRKKA